MSIVAFIGHKQTHVGHPVSANLHKEPAYANHLYWINPMTVKTYDASQGQEIQWKIQLLFFLHCRGIKQGTRESDLYTQSVLGHKRTNSNTAYGTGPTLRGVPCAPPRKPAPFQFPMGPVGTPTARAASPGFVLVSVNFSDTLWLNNKLQQQT